MTSRAGKPDTAADIELRACLDALKLTSFVMVAGAGSGKTTSLVKALDHIAKTRGINLKRHGQKVACITYTEVAEMEIWSDVGQSTLFHVSTIHSFLWTVIRPFQADIRRWVIDRLGEKIVEAEAKIAKPRTQARTRERAQQDIDKWKVLQGFIPRIPRFTYGTGSDYQKGILGHDDVIKMVPALIHARPLLKSLVAQRFPFIFVDESQDTVPDVVAALKAIDAHSPEKFCLGFFGDPMQKIYATGLGPVPEEAGWIRITKPENFRCSAKVLDVINRIREPIGDLVQSMGRIEGPNGVIAPVEGTARMFILPIDEFRAERLRAVRSWLAKENGDPHWLSDAEEADVRVLVIVHRMAAKRLGFAELYAALNDNNPPPSLKDGFLDGTAWALKPFLSYLLPLVQASIEARQFDVMALLRKHFPALSKDRLVGADLPKLLQKLKQDLGQLVNLLNREGNASIGEVLLFVREQELATLESRLCEHLDKLVAPKAEPAEESVQGEEAPTQCQTMMAFFATPAKQMWGYRTYIEDESPFSTQQGVKGAEFKRVLAILDDDEGSHNQFSYNKYFGISDLSETDLSNIADRKDSVLDRTRRLFYVCCSRAIKDLAAVLFADADDVTAAHAKVVASGIFPPDQVQIMAEKI
jgi:DNA helicase II / ATP-dependent DNA helicase PcrA